MKHKSKKFDEQEFNKRVESFNVWEQRRKEKIKKLREEQKEKEIEKFNSKNIHHKKKLPKEKISSIINRLYNKDINKREQNKIILTQIYTPTFTPFIYTKKENIKKNKNKNKNENEKERPLTKRSNYYNEEKDGESDSDEEKNNNYNTTRNYNRFKYLEVGNDKRFHIEYEEEDDEKINGKYKRASNSQRHLKKVEKGEKGEKMPKHGSVKIIKIKKSSNKHGRNSDNEDEETERVVIENALRNRLFKHKK